MKDFAFIQLESGRYLCGLGPFRAQAQAPEEGTAFYRSSFSLDDPAPWKVPSEVFETGDLRVLLPENGATPLPEISWGGLDGAAVREVFDEILRDIESGSLQKSVPVLAERGSLKSGEPAALVKALSGVPEALIGYGYREGGSGMIGLTPEELFSLHDRVLSTMALAGTAPRHEVGDFPNDDKEIREHELVADYLVEKLSALGEVRRGQRRVLDLGTLIHFLTKIEVALDAELPLDDLIKMMHPTPALGACPRGDGALKQLQGYRDRLRVPGEFGAPFGALHDGVFRCLVAIRNVSWDGGEVALPSGVGVVRGSRFDREWRELALKRNSVKSLLGV
ncbi:MAG: chorismate-binding protein [Verrucomicrobiota bacterium]